ncbi:hypothetical protein A33Q_2654 [Indibacter alkaliphilus LW1]|uniref:Fibrobacter succinogenes major paralogous domain-containing protein n=1 Tax=Indibacter alkaliphilus (strain CCUG 57479 / KCTC 22604 / LW1) TaxID=1189612 RepID=S2DVJ7_INDAL|nr:fibrobacter succinogenes major paralogous domain-containing protein [Indibacter alkaliphilus]EOZ96061.1 hypothetical protein A33Q_2654 [Indibacter alkaliphilus LW1]
MKNQFFKGAAFLLILILSACFSEQNDDDPSPAEFGSFTDDRDGQVYRTIQIGNQIWMADNLNFETEFSRCYENNSQNCEIHGRLYNWWEAMEACPDGWKLPSIEDFTTLLGAIGGSGNAGALKSRNIWDSPNLGGTNNSGFSALPSGRTDNITQNFNGLGELVEFWTATETSAGTSARYFTLFHDREQAALGQGKFLTAGGSCRCIKIQ